VVIALKYGMLIGALLSCGWFVSPCLGYEGVGADVESVRRALTAGETDHAVQLADRLLVERPESVEVLNVAGEALLQRHRERYELWHLSRLGPANSLIGNLEQLSTLQDAEHNSAQYRCRLERSFPVELQRAHNAYEKACVIAPDNINAVRGLARTSFLRGEKKRALNLVSQVLAATPQDGEFLFLGGRLKCALVQLDSGWADLLLASKLSPDDPERRYWLLQFAFLLRKESEIDRTMNWFREFSPQTRDDCRIRAHIEEVVTGNGRSVVDFGISAGFADAFIEDFPSAWESWSFRGGLKVFNNQCAEAIPDLTRGLELVSSDTNPYRILLHRALAYQVLGDREKELADLNAVITNEPDALRGYAARMLCLEALGRSEESIFDRRKVSWLLKLFKLQRKLDLQPEEASLWIDYGELTLEAERFRTALAAFGEALTFAPESAIAYTGRARARIAMNQYREAVQDSTRAIELGATTRAWSVRGDAWLKLNRPDLALEDFYRARRLDDAVLEAQRLLEKQNRG
jgi:tetratricopeptide (TPR) repeat protein